MNDAIPIAGPAADAEKLAHAFEELARTGRALGPYVWRQRSAGEITAVETACWSASVAEPWWQAMRAFANAAGIPIRTFVAGDAILSTVGIEYVVAVAEARPAETSLGPKIPRTDNIRRKRRMLGFLRTRLRR